MQNVRSLNYHIKNINKHKMLGTSHSEKEITRKEKSD